MRKKKPRIFIKPENRGKFTAWAKRKGLSMSEAIKVGKRSKNPVIRKRAIFAENARKWNKKRKKA